MIQSVDRAMKILDYLSQQHGSGISTLAQLMKIDKSTVSRLISTLQQHDMVRQEPSTGKYYLGYRILYYNSVIRNNLNIVTIAGPLLREASQRLRQSIHLCALTNDLSVFVIDQIKSQYEYTIAAHVGMIEPIHASSVGKCLIAFQPEDRIKALLKNYEFTQFTSKTIINKNSLLEEYGKIQKEGYAVDNEEVSRGVCCIAFPIYDADGVVRYSVAVSGLKDVICSEKFWYYVNSMKQVAAKISTEIGYRSGAAERR